MRACRNEREMSLQINKILETDGVNNGVFFYILSHFKAGIMKLRKSKNQRWERNRTVLTFLGPNELGYQQNETPVNIMERRDSLTKELAQNLANLFVIL